MSNIHIYFANMLRTIKCVNNNNNTTKNRVRTPEVQQADHMAVDLKLVWPVCPCIQTNITNDVSTSRCMWMHENQSTFHTHTHTPWNNSIWICLCVYSVYCTFGRKYHSVKYETKRATVEMKVRQVIVHCNLAYGLMPLAYTMDYIVEKF